MALSLRSFFRLVSATNVTKLAPRLHASRLFKRNIATTKCVHDLMEFFEDKKNWGQDEVKTGRAWNLAELRLKSNPDLHKLWYVLLKERNMLLTMEAESIEQAKLFASPERLDKVEISMENLESVVRERNRAYHLLETGETGEIPVEKIEGHFGLPHEHKAAEYLIPKEENEEWQKEHTYYNEGKDVLEFRRKYREQENKKLERQKNRDFQHVIKLINRFPNMDIEALKEKFPGVDIEKAKANRKCKIHFLAQH